MHQYLSLKTYPEFSYTLVHHLNKKKKIKKFQIFSVISIKWEDVPYRLFDNW